MGTRSGAQPAGASSQSSYASPRFWLVQRGLDPPGSGAGNYDRALLPPRLAARLSLPSLIDEPVTIG